jgi:hypothetical protein
LFPSGLATQILAHTELPLYLIILDKLCWNVTYFPSNLPIIPCHTFRVWQIRIYLFSSAVSFLLLCIWHC